MFILISCENQSELALTELTLGTYKGHFTMSTQYAKYAPSKITLIFTTNGFLGEVDFNNNRAVCKGTYKITGQEIEFFNTCSETDEFYWTYVLNGKFELSVDAGQLEMRRYLNGGMYNYILQLH